MDYKLGFGCMRLPMKDGKVSGEFKRSKELTDEDLIAKMV